VHTHQENDCKGRHGKKTYCPHIHSAKSHDGIASNRKQCFMAAEWKDLHHDKRWQGVWKMIDLLGLFGALVLVVIGMIALLAILPSVRRR
jgi:hypothetical protein